MKIQIASDTHFEHYGVLPSRDESLYQRVINCIDKRDTVLLLVGDIISKPNVSAVVDYYKTFFKDVIHVSGNHEYYQNEIDSDYKSVVVDDTEFVMATLWTNFDNSPFVEWETRRQINDFHLIDGMTTSLCKTMFYDHVDFITQCIDNPKCKNQVIATHFAPHPMSTHEQYKGQTLNGYFINNLDGLICAKQPKLWIHGHCHNAFDYMVGDTRIVCNPHGYSHESGCGYNNNLVIEL